MKRENYFLESYKALDKLKAARESKRIEFDSRKIQNYDNFIKDYHSIMESRESNMRKRGRILEEARNDALATIIEAIYISALEAGTLTDNGLILADSLTRNWIKENGGAQSIMNRCKNNTYLLNRISSIMEDAAEDELKDIEDIDNDSDEKDDEDKESKKEKEDKKDSDDTKDEKKDDEEEDKEKDSSDDDKDEEDDDSDDDEAEEESPEEDDSDPLSDTDFEDNDTEIPDDATTTEDDNETDVADDIVDDLEEVPDKDITVDGNEENQGKIFDELEKEEDVQKAIELIRQRVADAEETFIRRNAEDKKQIDDLIGRISDNVKTVEDMNDEAEAEDNADSDSTEAKLAEESVRVTRRKIKDITENRTLSVLEKMSRNLTAGIVKDHVIREQYTDENGKLDVSAAFESAKVMYGFLETLNTLQLEKVDAKYIENVLSNM